MSNVKRYVMKVEWDEKYFYYVHQSQSPDGAWVKYSDHEAAVGEAVREALEKVRERIVNAPQLVGDALNRTEVLNIIFSSLKENS